MLWPYRRSALKNQKRWTFGVVLPPSWAATRPDERARVRAEVLATADGADAGRVSIEVRFLHEVRRRVARLVNGSIDFDDSIDIDGERFIAWNEATERSIALPPIALEDNASGRIAIRLAAGSETEWLSDASGARAGAIVREWNALEGFVEARVEAVPSPRSFRIRVDVLNDTVCDAATREDALRSSFLSLHVVLRAEDAELVSMQDPPPRLADAASACDSDGLWPVLVDDGPLRGAHRQTSRLALAAPIILSDFPAVAPESPGDLFDGGEVDELLVYNIMALTDQEKDEMRASDPRTREILERTASLTPEQIARLHGTFRDVDGR
jgi:hypothetical protein